jgi:hypothetical protein
VVLLGFSGVLLGFSEVFKTGSSRFLGVAEIVLCRFFWNIEKELS